MFAVALAWSPSLSVTVAVSVTRSAAASVFASLGSVVGCTTARCWSSVSAPVAASTLTTNTTVEPASAAFASAPALPTTVSPTLNRNTPWFVAVSTRPLATPADLTPSA